MYINYRALYTIVKPIHALLSKLAIGQISHMTLCYCNTKINYYGQQL